MNKEESIIIEVNIDDRMFYRFFCKIAHLNELHFFPDEIEVLDFFNNFNVYFLNTFRY